MAKKLAIITQPNKILRKKSAAIDSSVFNTKKLKELCADMAKTMLESDGAGLAAPQIGQNIRLAVINTQDGVISLLNPKISKKSWTKIWDSEGCLSVPGVYGKVKRHKKITCKYLTVDSQKKTIEAEGMLARVIQHEVDHLDGILFIDKAMEIEENPNI